MSKHTFSDQSQNIKASVLFSMNAPALPNFQRQSTIEKRIADPSSTQPKGLSYPIPSFFEYRARPKELDGQ